MRLIFTFILVGLYSVSWSQDYRYPKNNNISDSNGVASNIGCIYFPPNMFMDTVTRGYIRDIRKVKTIPLGGKLNKDSVEFYDSTYIHVDTISLNGFSKFLYSSNEPILCNYYLGEVVYRLTWLRSFHPDIVIKIVKRKKDVVMICKKVSGFMTDDIYEQDKKGRLIRIRKSEPKFLNDTILYLDKKIFTDFEEMIKKNEFNRIPNTQYEGLVCDGSEWILEMHKPNTYWVVNRWSPNYGNNPKFRELCDYLIDKSIFKNERKY